MPHTVEIAMDSSQIFGFCKILSESTVISFKNAKLLAPITALSLLLTSIIFMLFSFSYQCATAYMISSFTDSISGVPFLQIGIYFALILAVDLAFMISYIAVVHASGVATVIISAASLAGAKMSVRDLCTRSVEKSRIPFRKNLRRGSVNLMHMLSITFVGALVLAVVFDPNPFTIAAVSIAGVWIFVYHLYASVVQAIAGVIPVLEDGCEAAEAAEKAEKLVEGQRIHGFMVNMFINVLGLIVLWSFWMIVGDRGSMNVTVYGLFFMNWATATRAFLCVVYTVYYFQCKEYHGEKVGVGLPGIFHYTSLENGSIP